jgi:hypothetical protein
VGIFLLFEGGTRIVKGIKEFRRQAIPHTVPGTCPCRVDNPPHTESFPPGFPDFYRHLIGSAAHPAALYLYGRLYIIERLEEYLQRLFFGLLLKNSQRVMHDPEAYGTLAFPHHAVNEFGNYNAVIPGIRHNAPVNGLLFAAHNLLSLSLRPFGAVLRAPPLAVFYTQGILGPADNMITDTGKILDTAAPNQNHRVFLEVMPDAGNIGGYFSPMRETHTGDRPEGRFRLLGGHGHDTGTYSPLLRTGLEGRRLGF